VIETAQSLPFVPAQATSVTDALPALADVLVVDDDSAMAGTLVAILALSGIRAKGVTSASDAIVQQRVLRPTVVLCDQRLPDMAGLDLCAAIRSIDPDVSLILLTGHASLDTAIAAVGQIDQYLTKPAPPEDLVASVRAGAERTAQRRAERIAAADLRQKLEAELRRQALHDALTGLPNRALFVERARHALERRDPSPMVVCFLDLDEFKDVNDTFGHSAGDELLRSIAARLTHCLRPEDTVARFGGDEFAILLENTDLPEAVEIVQRLQALASTPMLVGDDEVLAHTSVGLTVTAGREVTSEQLLAEADAAMYAAKARGGNCFEVFDPEMRVASELRSRTRRDIDRALARSEFAVRYQPVVDLRTGQRCGVEALVRWRHPTRGELSPAEFIDHAEASGQIVSIGSWVLDTAVRAVAARPHLGFVAINLSARQLQQDDLADVVAEALAASGLSGDRLVLEITETATVADPDNALRQLTALRALGLRLALDDFGTGYSSLRYLREFPVSDVKIDQSFVENIASREDDRAIVRGVIDIAHALGKRTIAEGVETDDQREVLVDLGCDLAQGFLWTPAVAIDEIGETARL
jgi:diguanylate cyclase (GGDEF)-like protein